MIVSGPDGDQITLPLSDINSYVLKRIDTDDILFNTAKSIATKTIENFHVESVHFGNNINVVEGNFPKQPEEGIDEADTNPETDAEDSEPVIAGAAGKKGVKEVVKNIEETNRNDAIANTIEEAKDEE